MAKDTPKSEQPNSSIQAHTIWLFVMPIRPTDTRTSWDMDMLHHVGSAAFIFIDTNQSDCCDTVSLGWVIE